MKKKVRKKMMTGWGTRGRPFSEKEFNRSYIKKNINWGKNSYANYLEDVSKELRTKKGKTAMKSVMK